MIEKVFLTRRQITLLLALLVFVIQACFVNELGWNQKARITATFAFVEPNTPDTGTFRINRFYQNPTRGLKAKDWARSGTQYYPNKAPKSFMLGIPAYYISPSRAKLNTVASPATNARRLRPALFPFVALHASDSKNPVVMLVMNRWRPAGKYQLTYLGTHSRTPFLGGVFEKSLLKRGS